jgi:hypothetical protein
VKFTRITPTEARALETPWWREIQCVLTLNGFTFNLGEGFDIRNFRVDVKTRGYNRGGYSYFAGHHKNPKRTNVLSWFDWVEVHALINAVMDRHGISARVFTLGGKFEVRHPVHGARTEAHWEKYKYENVGSMFYPVARVDLYRHESFYA